MRRVTCLRLLWPLSALALLLFFISWKANNSELSVSSETLSVSECSLAQGSCALVLEEVTFDLHLLPLGLPPMQPLTLEIAGAPAQLAALNVGELWFVGQSMDMGQHFLFPVSDTVHDRLVFQGAIPVCSVDPNMRWQLMAELEWQGRAYHVVFRLD